MIINKSGVERTFCDYCDRWLEEKDFSVIVSSKGKKDEHYCSNRHYFDKRERDGL